MGGRDLEWFFVCRCLFWSVGRLKRNIWNCFFDGLSLVVDGVFLYKEYIRGLGRNVGSLLKVVVLFVIVEACYTL